MSLLSELLKTEKEEWGENCSSYETIVLKRGKLYYKDGDKLIPLEEVK